MPKHFRLLVALLFLALCFCLQPVGADRPTPQGHALPGITPWAKVEPALLKQASVSDEPLRFIVHLREQSNLRSSSLEPDRLARRRRVVRALQATAQRSQASIRAYLSGRRAASHVRSFTPYWIFNGLAVVADAHTLLELAQRPDVDAIRLDRERCLSDTGPHVAGDHSASRAAEWNIERIGAALVWDALGIDGTGVVVASMDTGVDWEHPALQSRYRGYDPKGFHQHRGNWFCATDEGYLYPGDGYGHGTHTMGLLVGRDGDWHIGVAPGAQWIAVKIFDNQGHSYDSWIHSGFQWLLAPEGDAALAPQVVNNSWGSDVGGDTTFQPDLQALRAAGILPVFSAGNGGPGRSTVGSPGAFPEAFAVGATDAGDEIAAFSGRGPSPWAEVKPELVAPGVDIRSSVPGGAYELSFGTSMAAPHVAGAALLLLQARPSLTVSETESMLTGAARPLGESIPNNDYGWGLVDAYGAVASAVDAASIVGRVTEVTEGLPLAGATVRCTALEGDRSAQASTDPQGHYQLVLAAGSYSLTASAFAYHPQIAPRVILTRGQEVVQEFSLIPMPVGVVRGRVTEVGADSPLSATLEVVGTPVRAQSDPESGLYSLTLPAGTYTLTAKAPGHRVGRAQAVVVMTGEVAEYNFSLLSAPSLLVVDSGPWYSGSEIQYYTQVLDELDYLYDLWSIRQPFADIPDTPSATELMAYDVVIWSAPHDSPGYIGADEAIKGFLEGGGLLLLSGQDIGYWDGRGTMTSAPYFSDYLQARYVKDDSGVRVVSGQGDLFAGLSFGIQGGDGAGNQLYPDEIQATNPDHAASALRYQEDGSGGQWVGLCQPYRVLYLAFGFEAIDSSAARREVMDRALTWLVSSRPAVGVELQVTSREPHVGTAGRPVTHALRLRNTGDGGESSVYHISLGPSTWPAALTRPVASQTSAASRALTLSLSSCQSTTLAVEVAIPLDAARDTRQQVNITALAREEGQPSAPVPSLSQTVTVSTKTPAPVLLIDDDRWYDQEARYHDALEGIGIAYDDWQVGWGGRPGDGSPSPPTLAMYPVVVWFTGYDWYETLTAQEEARLGEYLAQGGRLLLSSQDYLFTRGLSPLGVEYLGILTYTEDLSTTLALGVEGSPVGDALGPYELTYPFPNWSDALVPTVFAEPAFLGGHGHPIALILSREDGVFSSKTTFFAFPLEALPRGPMAEVVGRTVGWLSWLGDSSLAVDRSSAKDGEQLTYSARLQNDGLTEIRARFEGQVPTHTTYVSGSASAGAHREGEWVIWEGSLEPRASVSITYAVQIESGLPPAIWVTNVGHMGYADDTLSFSRRVRTRVNAPNLSPLHMSVFPEQVRSGETLTYQVSARNEGWLDAPKASMTVTLPSAVKVVSGSLAVEGGGVGVFREGQVLWSGPISVGRCVTISHRAVATRTLADIHAIIPVEIDDGLGVVLRREIRHTVAPYRSRLLSLWKTQPQ